MGVKELEGWLSGKKCFGRGVPCTKTIGFQNERERLARLEGEREQF